LPFRDATEQEVQNAPLLVIGFGKRPTKSMQPSDQTPKAQPQKDEQS
jgi:hypothetical protein